jgi:glucokinase
MVATVAAASCVIGVDLGGTKLLAGVADEHLAVHHRAYRQALGLETGDLLDACVAAVEEARAAAPADIQAVGFGIPCLMDQERGMAVMAVNLPLIDVPFRDIMTERLGLPVIVDNDANCAALCEARVGAGVGCSELVLLTIGTGIGGGIVARGHLQRGASGAAGEPGHMTIDADGPPCPGDCPGRGCLEAYVSGPALARVGGRDTATEVINAARSGDAAAVEAVAKMGEKLGAGIANLLNLLEPEVVVVGGGVAVHAGDLLLEHAEKTARARALEPAASNARIVVAELGIEAGMLGAAMLALDGGVV